MSRDTEFQAYLKLTQQKQHIQWEAQHLFFSNSANELPVDFIGCFENYTEDIFTVLRRPSLDRTFFGFKQRNISKINSGVRAPYQEYYDDESRDMVATFCAEDIKRFHYQFDQ